MIFFITHKKREADIANLLDCLEVWESLTRARKQGEYLEPLS